MSVVYTPVSKRQPHEQTMSPDDPKTVLTMANKTWLKWSEVWRLVAVTANLSIDKHTAEGKLLELRKLIVDLSAFESASDKFFNLQHIIDNLLDDLEYAIRNGNTRTTLEYL